MVSRAKRAGTRATLGPDETTLQPTRPEARCLAGSINVSSRCQVLEKQGTQPWCLPLSPDSGVLPFRALAVQLVCTDLPSYQAFHKPFPGSWLRSFLPGWSSRGQRGKGWNKTEMGKLYMSPWEEERRWKGGIVRTANGQLRSHSRLLHEC